MLKSIYFRRLFIPYLLLILAGTVVSAFYGAAQLRSTYLSLTESSLYDECKLVSRLLIDDIKGKDYKKLKYSLNKLSSELNIRITIINPEGIVLADSDHNPAEMDNHATRPEVIDCQSGDYGLNIRRSDTLHQEMMYLSLMVNERGEGYGYVRLSISLQKLDDDIYDLYLRVAFGSVIAFFVAGLICYAIALRTVKPILKLTSAANILSNGDFLHRIHLDEAGEVDVLADALNHLGESIVELIERISKDEEELRAILSSMVEGVIALDSDRNIKFANESAGQLFDFSVQNSKNRHINEVIKNHEVLDLVINVIEEGKVKQKKVGATTTALDLEVVVCPLRSSGEDGGVILVAHDVAESQRYQKLRSEFVANASHELRTPLTFIRGFLETLQSGAKDDPEKLDQYMNRIGHNVEQLINLINDLLQLSELEERPESPTRSEFDLVEMLKKLCDTLKPLAIEKNQTLDYIVSGDIKPINGFRSDMERAFTNFLENAIKYTDHGGLVTVRVSMAKDYVVVKVEDTGIGIPESEIPRIFERFYRVDKSRSREMGGTGLGLAIAKHVILSHNGKIEVSSKLGQGTSFVITIPA